MLNELKQAIEAAGAELRDHYEWSLDGDDEKPILETVFAQVVLKHTAPVMGPAAAELARKARIAALRNELAVLEYHTP